MTYILVRHKVGDFAKWKAVYDESVAYMEDNTTLVTESVFQNSENPNEVFVLVEFESKDNAQEYMDSDYLRDKMQQAGVAEKPDIWFLDKA